MNGSVLLMEQNKETEMNESSRIPGTDRHAVYLKGHGTYVWLENGRLYCTPTLPIDYSAEAGEVTAVQGVSDDENDQDQ